MSGTSAGVTDRLAYYASQPYAIKILAFECDACLYYVASHPELYGCLAQGRTPAEALYNLAQTRPRYLAMLLEMDLEIPLPTGIMLTLPPDSLFGSSAEYRASKASWFENAAYIDLAGPCRGGRTLPAGAWTGAFVGCCP
jgi:predicted RNase H-like HicB family nuclease